jgi:hypothetical protein
MNWFTLLWVGKDLLISAWKQNKFNKSYLNKVLNDIVKKTNYNFSNKEAKKVFYYYPIFTIMACAEMYLALKGRGLTIAERKRLSIVCVMATLFDDLIDEEKWNDEMLLDLLHEKLSFHSVSSKAQLIYLLNNILKTIWVRTEKFNNALQQAIFWQIQSQKQLNEKISLQEIENICRKKNGYTSLMFAYTLDENWNEPELDFIFQSAMVGQLVNDVFDVYKDSQDGIYSMILQSPNIKMAEVFFINECKKLHQSVLKTSSHIKSKNYCINRMSCLHGFALVAFNHLQNTENKYGKPIPWKRALRKELVTDLEWWSHRFKLPIKIMWLSKQR